MSTYQGVNTCLSKCLDSVLNVKVLVVFNQEKALVGAFSLIVESSPINRLQTVPSVAAGAGLAVAWPGVAMFGTLVYYVVAGANTLLGILHR